MYQTEKNQLKIWLLEEDPDAVSHVRQACGLFNPPISLVVVQDSEEALEWMTTVNAQSLPDLLLLDLNLPKLNGLAVLRRLRMNAMTQDLHIVVYSAMHEAADVQQSYQVGANSFVEKPVSVADFNELLSAQIAYWLKPR